MIDESTRLIERYQRLIELSHDLATTLDLRDLLNHIVHAAADLSGSEAASILTYDEMKGELYFDATSNLEEPLMRGLVVPAENSIAGWIVNNRQPVIISDTQSDPRHFGKIGIATQVTTNSMLGVPLIAKDKVIGVLEAINKLSGDFDLEDQEILTTLAAQASVAIENARLFQQSDLISEMVHELRTPLSSINMAASLLMRPESTLETRQEMAEMIFDETQRLNEMATAFLDLARLESGRVQFQPQMVEVRPLLEECIQVMQSKIKERELKAKVECPSDLPAVKADRDKLKQVFINLLSNAIKYNQPAGKIDIRAETADGEIVVHVSDTGLGISPEHQERLFEKFYRVPGTEKSVQGTGLGLSICKRIVEAHRGSITFESQVGVGTDFVVRLPL
ncbi:MAG: ATP-binding protein [Anaerolineales bacterium]|jgi:signal transduction histidine kinase